MRIAWNKRGLGNRQLILEILQFAEMFKQKCGEYPDIFEIYAWFEDISEAGLCEAIIGAVYHHKLATLDELGRLRPLIKVELPEELKTKRRFME